MGDLDRFCACGRSESECDGSRKGCHTCAHGIKMYRCVACRPDRDWLSDAMARATSALVRERTRKACFDCGRLVANAADWKRAEANGEPEAPWAVALCWGRGNNCEAASPRERIAALEAECARLRRERGEAHEALRDIRDNYDHEHHSLGSVTREQCDGPGRCRCCTAESVIGVPS